MIKNLNYFLIFVESPSKKVNKIFRTIICAYLGSLQQK